jgi:quinol monooxygenase YgiN
MACIMPGGTDVVGLDLFSKLFGNRAHGELAGPGHHAAPAHGVPGTEETLMNGPLFFRLHVGQCRGYSAEHTLASLLQNGMKLMRRAAAVLLFSLASACGQTAQTIAVSPLDAASPNRSAHGMDKEMIVRLSELDIDPQYLEQYKTILKEEAEASVRLEPGVTSIFPMHREDDPTAIRILEIYASREAYELHLKTAHFQKYKTLTLKMVKSLRLVDMAAIDAASMTEIFKKLHLSSAAVMEQKKHP